MQLLINFHYYYFCIKLNYEKIILRMLFMNKNKEILKMSFNDNYTFVINEMSLYLLTSYIKKIKVV